MGTGLSVVLRWMGEKGEGIRGLGDISKALRGTGDPERPRVFAVGEPRYESVEAIKASSSVSTVLMVGVGLEQVEILIDDEFPAFSLAFGPLTSNISSQADLYSTVKGWVFDQGG